MPAPAHANSQQLESIAFIIALIGIIGIAIDFSANHDMIAQSTVGFVTSKQVSPVASDVPTFACGTSNSIPVSGSATSQPILVGQIIYKDEIAHHTTPPSDYPTRCDNVHTFNTDLTQPAYTAAATSAINDCQNKEPAFKCAFSSCTQSSMAAVCEAQNPTNTYSVSLVSDTQTYILPSRYEHVYNCYVTITVVATGDFTATCNNTLTPSPLGGLGTNYTASIGTEDH